ncbi:MAG: sugar kinase, ribokinase [Rickettsiaceae bacterium]|jgi:sugar/nucleoside kinase (ribokinase family)|nr:sugar kinase, ribokinase [Rickettsiaceae bacterium]
MSGIADTAKQFDVIVVGNAIVDTLIKTNDAFLESLGLKKGSMNLIDDKKAKQLFDLFSSVTKSHDSIINEMSGGTANVSAGISSFGGKSSFIGKISSDQPGDRFATKLKERGIEFSSSPSKGELSTGRSLIIVTEDGARTMCTYLGSSGEINKDDLKEDLIAQSKILFITGFLLDCKNGKETCIAAIEIARKNNCKIAFSLSDYLCVERHKKDMLELVENHTDILFANKKEINALCVTSNHEDAIKKITEKYAGKDKIAAITCSAEGVIIINKEAPIKVEAVKVADIKDTTGSGSLFVSGFLYAHTHGFDLEKSATLGNLCAAEGLKHLGARPIINLKDLIVKL